MIAGLLTQRDMPECAAFVSPRSQWAVRSPSLSYSQGFCMLLLIDNYDSFTWNLVQYFGALGQEVVVRRNDELSLEEIARLAPRHLVISPGPAPNEAGISLAAISRFAGEIPILGVCLGHQSLAQAFGARVVRARQVMHGKTSLIRHKGEGCSGLNNPLRVTRYHSLVVEAASLPDCLRSPPGANMPTAAGTRSWGCGIKHWRWRVQFHPESI